MKYFLSMLIVCIFFIGCGDNVTNINGYTEDEVQAKIDSVVMNQDTVIDTVYHESVDTVYQTNIDTVYLNVIDTVYSVTVDTVYMPVETVTEEMPRDTTITWIYSTDDAGVMMIYDGIVYKNVFYSTTTYPAVTDYYKNPYAQMLRINTNPCTNGLRLFNESDAAVMSNYLNKLIDEDHVIYLSTVSGTKSYGYDYSELTLTVAYQGVQNTVKHYTPRSASGDHETEKDLNISYVCAYDL